MAQHMLTPPNLGFIDKRKSASGASVADQNSRLVGPVFFTTNAVGTTTTAVGALSTVATGTNIVRLGDKFKLFNSAGNLKEETVFTVTGVADAASKTVTFSPAAAVATASGDTLRFASDYSYADNGTLDAQLNAFNSTLYSQANLDKMTQNDKVYALRVIQDPGSF